MIHSQVVTGVSQVVDGSVSSGSLGGAGLVAVGAVVVGALGLVYGLMRRHRKSKARRAADRSIRAAKAASAMPRTGITAPMPQVVTTAPLPTIKPAAPKTASTTS